VGLHEGIREWEDKLERRAPAMAAVWAFVLDHHAHMAGALDVRFEHPNDTGINGAFLLALDRQPIAFALATRIDGHFGRSRFDFPFADALLGHYFPALRSVRLTHAEADLNQTMM
jgi:hypothetical protein